MKNRIESIEMVELSKLKAHPKNPNKHSKEQIDRLALILEYQGFRYPIKVSKRSGFITSGHGRLEAAKILGLDKVPVSYQDYDDEDQEYADIVSDNAIANWADLDMSLVNLEVGELGPDFNIDNLGIKDFVIDLSEHDLVEFESSEKDKAEKHLLEVQAGSGEELVSLYEELLSRDFIVKYK